MIFLPMEDKDRTRKAIRDKYDQERIELQDAYWADRDRLQHNFAHESLALWEREQEELQEEGL